MHGEPIGFCDGGMSFPSRWQFEPGTTLAMTLEICGTGERARAEAVVVGCDRVTARQWCVTVLILETSADWKKIQGAKMHLADFDDGRRA